MSGKSFTRIVVSVALVGAAAPLVHAQSAASQKPVSPAAAVANKNTYEEMYSHYLEEAKHTPAPSNNWMADLMTDVRARHVNDLVTIRVEENLVASGSADANVTKTTKATVTMPSPISKLLNKISPSTSDTEFKGSGGSSRNSTITATMTVRVTDVLPNGDLVVEGVRQIEINTDRQVVVLTGVVRQNDIGLDNVTSSATVGQLRIQCIGQGLVKDGLSPGWLVRVLNKIF
jgi:flagellar L-ring protein precursor FlgH